MLIIILLVVSIMFEHVLVSSGLFVMMLLLQMS